MSSRPAASFRAERAGRVSTTSAHGRSSAPEGCAGDARAALSHLPHPRSRLRGSPTTEWPTGTGSSVQRFSTALRSEPPQLAAAARLCVSPQRGHPHCRPGPSQAALCNCVARRRGGPRTRALARAQAPGGEACVFASHRARTAPAFDPPTLAAGSRARAASPSAACKTNALHTHRQVCRWPRARGVSTQSTLM